MSSVPSLGGAAPALVTLAEFTRVNLSVRVTLGGAAGTTSPAAPSPADSALGRDQAYTAFATAIVASLGTPPATTTAGSTASASGTATPPSGNRVADTARAIEDALAAAGSPGADALLTRIQGAIDAAGRTLANSGLGQEAIVSLAADFRQALAGRLSALAEALGGAAPPASGTPPSTTAGTPPSTTAGTPPSTTAGTPPVTTTATPPTTASDATPASAPTSSATTATYRLTQKETVQLLTQEGDVVTIKLRSKEGFTATGASATGAAGLAAYAQVSAYSSSRFSVSIQGSLNADEQKAINDVLGQVDALATRFFSGSLADSFAAGAALRFDPTELAGVALKFSQTESLRITTLGAPPAAAIPAATPAATPTTTPAAVAGAPATPASDAAAPPADAAAPAATDTPPAPTTGSAAAAAPPSAVPSSPGSVLEVISRFLREVLAQLGTTTVSGSVTFSAKAKLELLAAAVGSASITPTEQRGAGLLKGVVGATVETGTPGPSPAA